MQKQRTVSQTWVEKMEENGRSKKWKKTPEEGEERGEGGGERGGEPPVKRERP